MSTILKRLENERHNSCCPDDEILWCSCERVYDKIEIGGSCKECGCAVEGVVILKSVDTPVDSD